MATTAEVQGFGARAPYAQPRQSEYEMKERVRLSGLFPRVRNEPLSNQLQALMKEFEKNAALTGILERRRRLEERLQFELKGTEGIDALNRNLAPPFRAGLANAATSASVADRLACSRVAGQLAAAQAAQEAADVMTGGNASDANLSRTDRRRIAAKAKATAKAKAAAGAPVAGSQQGGSESTADSPVFGAGVASVQPAAKAGPKANITRRPSRSSSRPRP